MAYQDYIQRDPEICGGEAIVKGTRVTVRTILASLAEGASVEEIANAFPTVGEEAIREIIAFAASAAVDDFPPPSSRAA